MKNFIKIIIIFEITIFVFPLHAMEQKPCYSVYLSDLEKIDPLLQMHLLPFWRDNKHFISPFNPLHEKSIAFQLATTKALNKSKKIKNKDKTLTTIYDAVCKGVSTTSWYNIELHHEKLIKIFPSQTPRSISELINNLPKHRQYANKDKENSLILTIVDGKLNRRKKLLSILITSTDKQLKIEVPNDIINVILLYLSECNVNEEEEHLSKLANKTRQEPHEEQKQIELE